MLCHELERAIHAHLASCAGYLSGEVDQSISALTSNDPAEAVNFPGFTLHFYRGETNDERKLPCVIVSCPSGDGELTTGNETCEVETTVVYAADAATENPAPIDKIKEVSDAVIWFLMRKDIVDQINQFAGDHLTVQGVVGHGRRRFVEGRTVAHAVTLQLYAANTNLIGQTPAQEEALQHALN
jgi:hypothetical protein